MKEMIYWIPYNLLVGSSVEVGSRGNLSSLLSPKFSEDCSFNAIFISIANNTLAAAPETILWSLRKHLVERNKVFSCNCTIRKTSCFSVNCSFETCAGCWTGICCFNIASRTWVDSVPGEEDPNEISHNWNTVTATVAGALAGLLQKSLAALSCTSISELLCNALIQPNTLLLIAVKVKLTL